MTAQTLPNTTLAAGFSENETGWSAPMNRNLRVIDALVNGRVVDKDLNAPPGSPAAGSMYIVGSAPTGAWAAQAGKLAVWAAGDDLSSQWIFVTPKSGWRVWVIDEAADYRYTSAWAIIASGSSGAAPVSWNTQTASYSLLLSDAMNGVAMNVASANNLTIPTNASQAIPIGASILIEQQGAGVTTVVAASGVTLRARGAAVKTAGQYALATLVKRGTDEWIVSGDLVA